MSTDDNGHPPQSPPTPPAFVRQLAERVDENYVRHRNLRELVAANHMAVMHEVGQLAAGILALGQAVEELRKMLAEMVKP